MEKMKKRQRLIIPFNGLKDGKHQFNFEVDASFFKQFENSIIKDADIHLDVDFHKKENMLQVELMFNGLVHSNCDRCTDPIDIPIEGEEELIVKFGDEHYRETDEIKILKEGDFELDISKEVYEYIHLLMPTKIAHENIGDCNSEVIAKLEELSIENQNKETEDTTDPRWAALLNLKDQKQ